MHIRSGLWCASAVLLVTALVGCGPGTRASKESAAVRPRSDPPAPMASLAPGVPPPARRDLTTLLLVTSAAGPRQVGSFPATAGHLWIRGRCAGGDLQLHVDPLAVLPMPCDKLGDLPFENRITLRRARQITISVVAPASMIWGLRVEQYPGQRIERYHLPA